MFSAIVQENCALPAKLCLASYFTKLQSITHYTLPTEKVIMLFANYSPVKAML